MFTMSTSRGDQNPAEPMGDSYHHGNLRVALVEAGLSMLEESASGELSLRELARRVGVSANATYRHFASKDALLAALAAEGFRRFTAALMEGALRARDAGNVERFIGAGLGYVRFARRNPALFRLMFSRFAGRHDSSEELRQTATAAYEVLRQGVAGSFGLPADNPAVDVAALHAWSLVHGLSHLILDGQITAQGEALEALVNAVIRGDARLRMTP